MLLKRVILTADDFGLSVPVNEAIEAAHRNGVLTTTSLMVGEKDAEDAVRRAKALPGLRVGLHLVVFDGRPVLPPEAVPDLVDDSGRFRPGHFRTGLVHFFRPAARRQLAAEIEAQFEGFRRTGLPLDHVNVHHHLHLHPTVLGIILRLGPHYGMRAVRLPREPWRPLLKIAGDRTGLSGRVLPALLLSPWAALMRLRLARAGLSCNDYLFGMADYGRMDEPHLLRLLGNLPDGVSEIHFHPSTDAGLSGGADRELDGLTSPAVAVRLRELGIEPVTFADLVPPLAESSQTSGPSGPSDRANRMVPDRLGRRSR